MHLRPRHAPAPPAPVERVRHVLAAASGGWVPPEDGGAEADGTHPETAAWSAAQEAASWAQVVLEEAEGSTVDHGLPRDEEPEPGEVPPRAVSWQHDDGTRSAAPGAHAAGLLSTFVPPSVLRGRFDPGRRGALALVLVATLGALLAGALVLRGAPEEVVVPEVVAAGAALPGAPPPASAAPAAAPGAPATGQEVVVSVAGKVRRPGLVRLPPGSRVDDAVRAAGGPVDAEALGLLNLARLLVDGEQVLVGVEPPPGAPAPGAAGPAAAAAPGGLLDLNAATVGDFDALPGIGPVLAQRILDWRTENGRFASVEQLREVTGIGEAKYQDVKDKVTV